MVELKGSLGSLGLPAIVQLIADLHHSGNLELIRNGSRGVLGFADGRLVTASYDDLRGLEALAACTLELAQGDFVFVEAEPTGEHTLNLRGSELQKLFGRVVSGEVTADTFRTPPDETDDPATPEICPFLGFVDDEYRHYSRPTALHRCYAASAPALVTAQEQRDLCLSDRYPTCPRFHDTANSSSATPSTHGLPAGVAPRMEAATQMGLSTVDPTTANTALAPERENQATGLATGHRDDRRFGLRSRRGLVRLTIGGALGLAILGAGLLLVAPSLSHTFTQTPSNVAAQTQPVGTQAPAATTVSDPTTAPAVVGEPGPGASPTPLTATLIAPEVPPTVLPSQLPRATAAPSASVVAISAPAAAPVPGQPLIDVRFASGPRPGWLDNPPYAMWSDGAYRLKATQPTRFVAVGAPVEGTLSDVVVAATLRKTGGPPGGGYGLIVRNQSSDPLDGVNQNARAYVLETGDRGEFGIWRRDGDQWFDLVPWTRSDRVRPGGSPNDLQVRALGDRLSFSVNGAQLVGVQDATLASGGVGVFVGGDYNEVALDRFVVQVPD